MKTMDEKILKYFSGKLSEMEKLSFEAELENNAELKKLFDKYSSQMDELKETNNITLNEAYFNNLLPRARQRIGKEKKKSLYPKLAYALPVMAVIIYFVFYSNKPADMFSKYVSDLPDSSKQQIVNYIDKEYASIPSDVIKDARTSELLENEISNSIDIQNLNIDPRFTYNDDYELLKKLSPEEANKIYNNLVDKKIL